MGSALELRVDFIGDDLHRLAQLSRGAALTRPLLSAQIYNGATRCDAATVGGVSMQVVRRYWVERFNARDPAGHLNVKAQGTHPKLDADQRREFGHRRRRVGEYP